MGKTAKELVREARKEVLMDIHQTRLKLLTSLDELSEVGGQDDYESGIEAIVAEHREGILVSRVRALFPDVSKFNAAREALKKAGKAEEVGRRSQAMIRPVAS